MTAEHAHPPGTLQDVLRCPGCKRERLIQVGREIDNARHQLGLLLEDRTDTPSTTLAELGRSLGAAWRGIGSVVATAG